MWQTALWQNLKWAFLGTGFTFLMTTSGAAMVLVISGANGSGFQKLVLGFAAGVMTAASVWSLLIPAIEQTAQIGQYLTWIPAAAGMLAGVIFLATLDALFPRLYKRRRAAAQNNPAALSNPEIRKPDALLAMAITLHNIPEGMAVGLACALAAGGQGRAGAAALALGIGIQNFPEGAAVSLPLNQEGQSRWKSFLAGMLSGIVEPIFGILAVLAAGTAELMMPWLLSFAAGAMLYVVVEELVPQAHSRVGTCGFVTGFLIMMVLDVALE